jgi:putative oxidoreductase
MDSVLLIARLFFGLGLAAHGAQKLFGWFGGHGLRGTAGFFEMLGFRPGRPFALGLFGPAGPAAMVTVMTVAALTVHIRNGFFVSDNGLEVPLLYSFAALLLAFVGPGALSLDAVLGLPWLYGGGVAAAAIAAAVAIGIGVAAVRRSPASAMASQGHGA